MSTIMRFHSTDEDHCRVYYTTRNKNNERLIYCLQQADNAGEIKFYRCSEDGEPSHEVSTEGCIFHFPKCVDKANPTKLELFINQFIKGISNEND